MERILNICGKRAEERLAAAEERQREVGLMARIVSVYDQYQQKQGRGKGQVKTPDPLGMGTAGIKDGQLALTSCNQASAASSADPEGSVLS